MSNIKATKVRIHSTFQYLQLLNGILDLTDTEMKILAEFIDVHVQIQSSDLELNAFSTEAKKKVAQRLGREDFNTLNNYIKRIHDKRILKKTSQGYEIPKLLIPSQADKIVFNLEWIKKV